MAGIAKCATRVSLWAISPDKLRPVEDLNSREDYGDLESLKQQIIAAGGVLEPFKGWWDSSEEVFYYTDGHRRHKALQMATEEGFEVETVKVELEGKDSTHTDHLKRQFLANSGKPLTPIERGRLAQRLLDNGESWESVSSYSGVTKQTLQADLELWNSLGIREMVEDGTVAPSVAKAAIRTHGDGAEDALQDAVDRAAADGRVRATATDLKKKPGRRRLSTPKVNICRSPTNSKVWWAHLSDEDPQTDSVGVGRTKPEALGKLIYLLEKKGDFVPILIRS